MWEEFLKSGKQKELEFGECLIKNLGGNIKLATKSDDISKHIDLYWISGSKKISFDVKAMKKINREDKTVSEDFHWLEITNVLGNPGWIYGSEDYVAFETKIQWIIVTPKNLRQLILNKVKNYSICTNKVPYTIYQRLGRLDKLVLVKTIDLMSIANKILWK